MPMLKFKNRFGFVSKFLHSTFKSNAKEACNNDGFSIVEAVVGIGISIVVIYSYLGFTAQTASFAGHQNNSARAYVTMQNVSERLLMASGQDASLDAVITHTAYYDRDVRPVATGTPAAYIATWVVTPDNPITDVARVDLKVSYIEGTASKFSAMTFYRRNPSSLTDHATRIINTPTPTPDPTPTPSATATATATATPTGTPTASASATATPAGSATITPTPTPTATGTPSGGGP
jgi:hypothetical protein